MCCAPPRSFPEKKTTPVSRVSSHQAAQRNDSLEFQWPMNDPAAGPGFDEYTEKSVFEHGSFEEHTRGNGDPDFRDSDENDEIPTLRRASYSSPSRARVLKESLDADDEKQDLVKKTPGNKKNDLGRGRESSPWKKTTAYRVKKGDTLYGLSKRFNMTMEEMRALNDLNAKSMLKAGMILKVRAIPGTERKSRKKTVSPGEDVDHPQFLWPVAGVLGVRKNGADGIRQPGITITGRSGAAVLSAASGVVKKIGGMRGYGSYVIIAHGERYLTVYAKLRDIRVREGERLPGGVQIASIGGEGDTLHFQIGHAGRPVDPLRLLPSRTRNGS